MNSLKACVKFYHTRRHKAITPCSEILRVATLARLPPDLLWSIFDFLPLVDLVSLSLCNQSTLRGYSEANKPATSSHTRR